LWFLRWETSPIKIGGLAVQLLQQATQTLSVQEQQLSQRVSNPRYKLIHVCQLSRKKLLNWLKVVLQPVTVMAKCGYATTILLSPWPVPSTIPKLQKKISAYFSACKVKTETLSTDLFRGKRLKNQMEAINTSIPIWNPIMPVTRILWKPIRSLL